MIEISKPNINKEEIEAVVRVLESKQLSQGPIVKQFEEEFAKYCGVKHAVAVNNGTAALHCALFALGINEGDEVITTPFTFVASANSIIMQNAKVVFSDIIEDDFNLDADKINEKITTKTKAIMPVDLFGQIFNVPKIKSISEKYNLKIIEDACQSVGAEWQDTRAGNITEATAFSLYATKNLTAGVGGVITTNDEKVMNECKLFRHHGQDETKVYEYVKFGYNYRMMDMIAAIALEQLKKADQFTKTRQENAKKFNEGLADIPGIILPKVKSGYRHVYHQYTVRITEDFKINRDEFMGYLQQKDILAKVFYPKPLHLYRYFRNLGYQEGDFPVAEKLANEVISLPVHPLVSDDDINYIIKTIKDI